MSRLLKQAETIISRKFSKDDNNYGLLVLGCFALLSKFGELYTPIVEKVMLETDIFIDNKNLKDLLREGGIEADRILDSEMLDATDAVVTAISHPGLDLYITSKGKIMYERGTPAIFCTTIGEDNTAVLNAFVHEASHLIKSLVNDIYCNKKTHFLIRSGLNIFGYSIKDGQQREINDNSMLDEVINVLQTSDMMQAVKGLNGMPMGKEVLSFYKDLDLERIEDLYGYSELTDFVLPLWSNDHFRNNIEDNIVIGRIDRIKNDFDSVLGNGAFNLYSTYLDYIDGNYDDEKLMNNMKDWYKRMNRLYIIKTRISKKKNS